MPPRGVIDGGSLAMGVAIGGGGSTTLIFLLSGGLFTTAGDLDLTLGVRCFVLRNVKADCGGKKRFPATPGAGSVEGRTVKRLPMSMMLRSAIECFLCK